LEGSADAVVGPATGSGSSDVGVRGDPGTTDNPIRTLISGKTGINDIRSVDVALLSPASLSIERHISGMSTSAAGCKTEPHPLLEALSGTVCVLGLLWPS